MAVDTLFDSVYALVQQGSTANVVPPKVTPGYETLPWQISTLASGITQTASYMEFATDGRIELSQSGYPTKPWGANLSIELVLQPSWAPDASLLENASIKVEASPDSPGVYRLFWNSYFSSYTNLGSALVPTDWVLAGEFSIPVAGRSYVRIYGAGSANPPYPYVSATAISVYVAPETGGSPTSYSFTVGGFSMMAPLRVGAPAGTTAQTPSGAQASANISADPVGLYADSVPSRTSFFVTFNRARNPVGGSVTISGCGVSHVVDVTGKTSTAISSELAAGYVAALTTAGYSATYSFNGTSYTVQVYPKASDPYAPSHEIYITGAGTFEAPAESVPIVGAGSYIQAAVYGAPPGVNQVTRFTVFVADESKDYTLTFNYGGVIATANLKNDLNGGLASIAAQLGQSAQFWTSATPGTFVGQITSASPGPVSLSSSLVENVNRTSAIWQLFALRVTGAQRTDTGFPALYWPTSNIPTGGSGTMPANVLLAANFEGGIGADLSQYAAAYSSAPGTSLSIQSTGSRTGDGYISNTDGSQGNDVYAVFAPSVAGRAAWQSATEMTVEFDLLVTAVAFSGGQIFDLGAPASASYFVLYDTDAVTCQLSAFMLGSAPATLITKNVWHHIALSYGLDGQGNSVAGLYVDGVWVDGSVVVPFVFDTNHFSAVTLFQFSSAAGGNNGSLQGGFDNLLITSARKYTANFTPPGAVTSTPQTADISAGSDAFLGEVLSSAVLVLQANFPDTYASADAVLDDVTVVHAVVIDGDQLSATAASTLGTITSVATITVGTPVNWTADTALTDVTSAADTVVSTPIDTTADTTLADVAADGLIVFLAPSEMSADQLLEEITSDARADIEEPTRLNAAITLPVFQVAASIVDGVLAGANITLPAFTVAGRFGMGAAISLPVFKVTSSATVTNVLSAEITLPAFQVSAKASVAGQATANIVLPAFQVAGYLGMGAAIELPAFTASGNITVGSVLNAAIALPAFVVGGSISQPNTLRAEITLPAFTAGGVTVARITLPVFQVMGSISPVLTAIYETYVVNMTRPMDQNPRNNFEAKVDQVTRYTNYPFTQVVRYGNHYYGVAADGLYLLEGETDNGTVIDWAFETCMTDFGATEKKNVASTYVGGETGPVVNYTIKSGDSADQLHASTTTHTNVRRNHRQKYGLGRRSRYYALGLAGQGDLAVDSIEFEVATTSRRI